MKILPIFPSAPGASVPCVAALGFFDGCHLGHRALLSAAKEEAHRRGLPCGVFTFSESGMKPGTPLLYSEEDRLAALAEEGIDQIFLSDFSSLRHLSPQEFVEKILVEKCRCELALCGESFRFGAGAAGNAHDLTTLMARLGKEGRILPQITLAGAPVSSSAVRQALKEGNPQLAAQLLGAPYTLSGKVTEGKRLGRTVGIPTANLPLPPGRLCCKKGVYATRTLAEGKWYPSITNIGLRPTVEQTEAANAETHILDFSGDLYGKRIRVEILDFIREERQFSSLEELLAQMQQDIGKVRK